MAAAGRVRARDRIPDSKGWRSIRRVPGAEIPGGLWVLFELLPPGTGSARQQLADLQPLSGIRARQHRDVHLRPVVHRRVPESPRQERAEQMDDRSDDGEGWTRRGNGGRMQLVVV